MTLFRSERLIALNDLILACREAANLLREAAVLSPDPTVSDALDALAVERTSLADDLAAEVLAEEDLPNAPNDEKTLLEAGLLRARHEVQPDNPAPLLDACAAKEDAVANAAEALLAGDGAADLEDRVAATRDAARGRVRALMAE